MSLSASNCPVLRVLKQIDEIEFSEIVFQDVGVDQVKVNPMFWVRTTSLSGDSPVRLHPDLVENYQDAADVVPPIVLTSDLVLVDGWHRLQAYQNIERHVISAYIIPGENPAVHYAAAVKLNSSHGQSLTYYEKRQCCFRLWGEELRDVSALAEILSIGQSTIYRWTEQFRATQELDRTAKAVELAKAGHSQWEIAKELGVSQPTVSRILSKHADVVAAEEEEMIEAANAAVADVADSSLPPENDELSEPEPSDDAPVAEPLAPAPSDGVTFADFAGELLDKGITGEGYTKHAMVGACLKRLCNELPYLDFWSAFSAWESRNEFEVIVDGKLAWDILLRFVSDWLRVDGGIGSTIARNMPDSADWELFDLGGGRAQSDVSREPWSTDG